MELSKLSQLDFRAALMVCFLALLGGERLASGAEATGIVIFTKENSTSADEFAISAEYSAVERHPWGQLVKQPRGPDLRLEGTLFKRAISYPILASMTIVDPADLAEFAKSRNTIAGYIKQYPSSKPFLDTYIIQMDAWVKTYEAGNVIIGGRIKSRDEYVEMIKKDQKGVNPIPLLVIGGKSLKEVQSASIKDGKLRLFHEAGVASFNVEDVPPAVATQLKEKFGLIIKQPANSNPAQPKMPTPSGS